MILLFSLVLSTTVHASIPTFDLSHWISDKLKILQSTTEYIEIVNAVGEVWLMYEFISEQAREWEDIVNRLRDLKHLHPPQVSFYAGAWFADRPAFESWMNFMDGGLRFDYAYDGSITGSPFIAFEETFSKNVYPGMWDPERGLPADRWTTTYDWNLSGGGRIELPQSTLDVLANTEDILTLEKATAARESGNLMASRATTENNKEAIKKLHEWLGQGKSHQASMDLAKAELQMVNAELEQQIELLRTRIERDATNRMVTLNATGAIWNSLPKQLDSVRNQRTTEKSATTSLVFDW